MVNNPLIRFAAQISTALYIALLFAEYLRPGFVSTVMNVHVMWVVIVPLILLTPLNPPINEGKFAARFALAIIGIILGLIVWHFGDVFGAMRFWFAVAVGLVPLVLFRVHR